MPKFTRRSSRIATAIALPAAVVAAGVLVSTSSYAAFSDTTSNEQNSWRAGTVQLADDAAGRTLFTAPNAKPGDGARRASRSPRPAPSPRRCASTPTR